MKNLENESLVYTINELAENLKISKSSAYQLARNKDFPTIRIGKRILIPVSKLKEWLTEYCNG